MAKDMKRSVRTIAVVLAVAGGVAGAAAVANSLAGATTAEPSACEMMTASAPPVQAPVALNLAIEPVGNTDKWADEATDFVTARIDQATEATMSAPNDRTGPVSPVRVTVKVMVNGSAMHLVGPCPTSEWTLAAAQEDFDIWAHSDKQQRQATLDEYRRFRDREIDAIASTVNATIRSVDPDLADGRRPKVSPIPLLEEVARRPDESAHATRYVGVLSPFYSNVVDCLNETTLTHPLTVDELIKNCQVDNQLPRIDGDDVVFEPYKAAHRQSSTLAHATAIANALKTASTEEH